MLTLQFAPSTAIDPFRSWVKPWLKVVVALIITLPVMLINGAYTGSNIDISSSLGVMSEDINMAYYVASAGMAIAYLVIPKVKPLATTKTIMLIVLLCQVILSLICAQTHYMEILVACSFLIGYFKAFSLVEIFNILIPALAPSGTRNEFYAKFYPITLSCGQLSLVLTGELAYMYKWQYMYYFMILLLLVAIIAVSVCMTYARRLIRIPFKEIDWISIFLVSFFYICIMYVATYGKTEDWFNSPTILGITLLIPILGWLFFVRQFQENSILDITVLKNRNAVTVYILSFVMMFFASFSILTSAYINNILRLENTRVTDLYLYMIPGIIIGAVICYYGYLKAIRMAWLIFIGFGCFVVAIAIIYFRVAPGGLYEDLYIPMILRGIGFMILFSALSIYAVYTLSLRQMLHNAFFIISFRSALAPVLGASLLTNWLYRLQQAKTVILMDNITAQSPLTMTQYKTSFAQAIAKGLSNEEAGQMALNSLYSKVQIQAATLSIKEISGWMLIIGIFLLVGILLYFFQFKPVKLMRTGTDMSG